MRPRVVETASPMSTSSSSTLAPITITTCSKESPARKPSYPDDNFLVLMFQTIWYSATVSVADIWRSLCETGVVRDIMQAGVSRRDSPYARSDIRVKRYARKSNSSWSERVDWKSIRYNCEPHQRCLENTLDAGIKQLTMTLVLWIPGIWYG